MEMEITFPGGVAVDAGFGGFTVRTDQPVEDGGEGSAPSPFSLFLASLGTCAGYYALRFCQERGIDTGGLRLTLRAEKGAGPKRLEKIRLSIRLPEGFPDKYRRSIVKATDICSVKRVIQDPPEFETEVE